MEKEKEKEKELLSLIHLYVSYFVFNVSAFMIVPVIIDVTMSAICPGQLHCSLAIYLSAFQQAVIGLGTLVMMPLIGNLSDKYGRKALLTLPVTLTIIPLAILAYDRSRNYFYAYYVLRTLTGMVCEGSVHCLALAYVADNVPEGGRASAFGVLSGIGSCAFVCGTLSARFLSTSSTFQVATFVAIVAAIYMRIYLPDSIIDDSLYVPIISNGKIVKTISDEEPIEKIPVIKPLPSLEDMMALLKSSSTLSQAAIVAFFSILADSGLHASMMYYLKARFHYNKDQFADLMVITGIAGTISQHITVAASSHHFTTAASTVQHSTTGSTTPAPAAQHQQQHQQHSSTSAAPTAEHNTITTAPVAQHRMNGGSEGVGFHGNDSLNRFGLNLFIAYLDITLYEKLTLAVFFIFSVLVLILHILKS